MLKPYEFYEAARIAQMLGGGNAVNKFDRIVGLPTLFSFDLANGWWGEVCEDSNPDDQPVQYTIRQGDNWDEEYVDTYVYSKTTKVRYIRFFKNTELKLVSDVAGQTDRYAEWYAANVNSIGELKRTVVGEYVYTGNITIVGEVTPENFYLPYVYFEGKYTLIDNGTVTSESTVNAPLIGSQTAFIYKNFDDINLSVYDEFVKAVRKFSDVYNETTYGSE